jgi:Kef-type K+ transport system membrane component KefB
MVIVFSFLLITGIVSSQLFDLSNYLFLLTSSGMICLAYIMFEVGVEFSAEKKSIRSYGWDFITASTAAILPALLWMGYFLWVTHSDWKPALLAGLSSAPTSAGVLFAMMTAAGLSATWIFKKARVLAVLDDLVTILLLAPVQILIVGFEWASIITCLLTFALIAASFRFTHTLPWPTSKVWRLTYAFLLTGLAYIVQKNLHAHWGVLIPAFVLGCLIKPGSDSVSSENKSFDTVIKGLFMLLVGLTFPHIDSHSVAWQQTAIHIVMLLILANAGKFFLVFCYQKEASLKERMALGVAMFPRGEVGAAVLLIGISYGLGGYENTLAMLSLVLNLVLTGAFIWIVIRLLKKDAKKAE